MQRVEKPTEWLAALNDPFEGTPEHAEIERQKEIAEFSNFAGAFGVKPPKPADETSDVAD